MYDAECYDVTGISDAWEDLDAAQLAHVLNSPHFRDRWVYVHAAGRGAMRPDYYGEHLRGER